MDTIFSAISGGFVPGPFFVILIFTALLAVAALAFFLYGRFYRRRLDRAIRGDASVDPAPEPRNAGKFILIALVAACVLWFLIWTVKQQKRLAKLEEDISEQMFRISELLDEQAETLRQQNSVFADMQVHCSAIHPETNTMDLTFTVTTKSAAEDTRVRMGFGLPYGEPVSLSDFGEIVEMEQVSDKVFSYTESFPLFENYYDENQGGYSLSSEDAGVIFELYQGGVRQTDTLFYKKTLWQEWMPRVWYSTDMDRYGAMDELRGAELVLCIQSRLSDLSLCSSNGHEVAESLDLSAYLADDQYTQYIPIRAEDFEALKTDRYGDWLCYLRYTDSYGFIHQRLLEPDAPSWLNTNPDVFSYLPEEERIFDADGNLLAVYKSNWKAEN